MFCRATLILFVLRTLQPLGALHGYGIARRIEQISNDVLQLDQGTLYPALLRMEQEGWIYFITAAGRRRLAKEPNIGHVSTVRLLLPFIPGV